MVLVLTTWPDAARAAVTARHLVEQRLAACVTTLPRHQVVYRWRGAIEDTEECQWIVKTTRGRLEELYTAVHTAHPYETPEWIVVTPAGGSGAYLDWVRASTAPAERL